MKKTEPKKTDNVIKSTIPDLSGYPNILTTAELSVIVSDITGTDIDGKRLRKILRKNGFNGNDIYKKYRFDKTDTETINRIIEIVSTDVTDRNRKRISILKRRTDRKSNNESVIRYRNGNVSTDRLNVNTDDDKTSDVNRNNVIPDGR